MRNDVKTAITRVRARCVHLPIVTTAAIAAVLVTAFRYRIFSHELALDVALRYGFSGRALSMGHWNTVITSQFLTRDAFMAVSIAASLALMLGVYEMIAGSARALIVMTVAAVAGPLLVAGTLGIGSSLGSPFAAQTLSTLDYGASAVTAGAGGALVSVIGGRRLRWFAIAWVLGGLVLHHQLADWEHLGSFVVGYGLANVLGTPRRAASVRHLRSRSQRSGLGFIAGTATALSISVLGGVVLGGQLVPGPAPARSISIASPLANIGAGRSATIAAMPARIDTVSYPTPSLGGTRAALVVLPAGYDATRFRYPVIEMLHGKPGAPNDIITGLDPVGAGAAPGIPPFIGIVPDGHGPVVREGAFADTSQQRLGTALSDDLRRWVDRRYRTNGHWGVTGLSEGGYGAAYLGSRTPGQYDSVCAMSGNFTPEGSVFNHQPPAVLLAANPLVHTRADGPRTLLIAGRSDSASVRELRNYAQALQNTGQPHSTVVAAGGHDWNLWHDQFPTCLRFMLATPAPAGAFALERVRKYRLVPTSASSLSPPLPASVRPVQPVTLHESDA